MALIRGTLDFRNLKSLDFKSPLIRIFQLVNHQNKEPQTFAARLEVALWRRHFAGETPALSQTREGAHFGTITHCLRMTTEINQMNQMKGKRAIPRASLRKNLKL